MKKCPFCAEEIQDEAIKCRYCGAAVVTDEWRRYCENLLMLTERGRRKEIGKLTSEQRAQFDAAWQALNLAAPAATQAAAQVTPKKKTSFLTGCAAVLFVVLALVVGIPWIKNVAEDPGRYADPNRSSSSVSVPEYDAAEVDEKIATLRSTGLLRRLDVENHQAYVNVALWNQINIDVKKGSAYYLAAYIDIHGTEPWVEIYDYQSGRKLARFSKSWGYKSYQ